MFLVVLSQFFLMIRAVFLYVFSGVFVIFVMIRAAFCVAVRL